MKLTPSYWSEIKNDFIDEDNIKDGILELHIDGYTTDDDDEDGNVIAKVIAINTISQLVIHTVYIDNIARIDSLAQKSIIEAITKLKRFDFGTQIYKN